MKEDSVCFVITKSLRPHKNTRVKLYFTYINNNENQFAEGNYVMSDGG